MIESAARVPHGTAVQADVCEVGTAATVDLRLDWTPYPAVLADIVVWETGQDSPSRPRGPAFPKASQHPARPGA